MTKTKTDNPLRDTTTISPPEAESAQLVGEPCPPTSTKSKGINARTVPASYKEGHVSLRYSPKEPPISDSSTDNK